MQASAIAAFAIALVIFTGASSVGKVLSSAGWEHDRGLGPEHSRRPLCKMLA